MKNIFKSKNTQIVLQGILGTLAVIHPAHADMIALAMGTIGALLPGVIKPADKAAKPAPKAE